MATAYKIQEQCLFFPSSGSVAYKTNPSTLSEVAQSTPPSYQNKKGILLTAQSPMIASSQPSGAPSDDPSAQKMSLEDYMNEILSAMVVLQGYMTQLDTAQNNTADSFIQLSIAQANQAVQNYKNYQAAVEAASHRTWWQKLCGYVVGAVMSLVGVITLQPELAIAGALTIAMTATGASDKISSYLEDHISCAGLRCLAEIGIGFAIAICIGGVSAGFETVGESAFSKGAADESEGFLSKFSNKMTFGRVLSSFGQSLMVVNPFIDFVKMCGGSDKTAEILGAVLGALATLGSGFAGASLSKGGSLIESLGSNGWTKSSYVLQKFTQFLKFVARPGFSIAGGVFSYEAGRAYLDQSDALDDLGVTTASQSLFQAGTNMANSMINQTQEGFKELADTYAMINSRWENYVAPYVTAAEIMG